MIFAPTTRPTMCFIGVTTAQSSINAIFPQWAGVLGLGDCELRGLDFRLHDEPARYREAVGFIKHDPLTRGALVTTHKIDLFEACRDQFDALDPLSESMGELSSLYKRDGRLHGRPQERRRDQPDGRRETHCVQGRSGDRHVHLSR